MGDGNGPNSPGLGGDNVVTGPALYASVGCNSNNYLNCPPLAADNMTAYPYGNNQQAARSMHANGLYICLADGSVQWISDYIDIAGNVGANPPIFSVWDRLNLSADGRGHAGQRILANLRHERRTIMHARSRHCSACGLPCLVRGLLLAGRLRVAGAV